MYVKTKSKRILIIGVAGRVLYVIGGIPAECLCRPAVCRMTGPCSEKDAHACRAGIIGCPAPGGPCRDCG